MLPIQEIIDASKYFKNESDNFKEFSTFLEKFILELKNAEVLIEHIETKDVFIVFKFLGSQYKIYFKAFPSQGLRTKYYLSEIVGEKEEFMKLFYVDSMGNVYKTENDSNSFVTVNSESYVKEFFVQILKSIIRKHI